MGCAPVLDPFGAPDVLIDRLIGNAYETVKEVRRHLGVIRYVAANLPALVALANGSPAAPAPPSGATLLIAGQTYSPDTSQGPIELNLGQASTFGEGTWVEVYDPMNNAETNNIVISAFAGDQIYDHGVSNPTHTIDNNNSITRYTVRNGQWRVTQYGG